MFRRVRYGPAVSEVFTINVQMRTVNFLVVGVSVRGATKVEPGKNDHTACSILVRPFCQFDLATRDVKHEELALVKALKGNPESSTKPWVIVYTIVYAVFLHREQSIRISLRQTDICQITSLWPNPL